MAGLLDSMFGDQSGGGLLGGGAPATPAAGGSGLLSNPLFLIGASILANNRPGATMGQAVGGGVLGGLGAYNQAQQIDFLNQYRRQQTQKLEQDNQRRAALSKYLLGGGAPAGGSPAASPGGVAPVPPIAANFGAGVPTPAYSATPQAPAGASPQPGGSRFPYVPQELLPLIAGSADPMAGIEHFYDKSREAPKVETFYDANGREVKRVFDPTSRAFVDAPDTGAKTDLLSPGAFAQKEALAKAGKTDVKLNVDNNLGKGLSENVKDIVAKSYADASSAVDTMNTTGRIRAALDKANLGPGATLRQGVDQFAYAMGIGGQTTEERLAATRQVIQGLSELALNARSSLKGQGQVSDYEGRLLNDARSGKIDGMTMPEIKTILDVADRLSQKQYGIHQRNLGIIQKNKSYSDLAPFYEVPPLPTAAPAAPPPSGGAPASDEGWQDLGGGVRIRKVQ